MPDGPDTDVMDLDADFHISDEDLTALALAADPDVVLDDDAVPLNSLRADGQPMLLPEWYMPVSASRARSDWRAVVAIAIAVGLVLINAFAICVTYGFPEIP
ncbi:MAG TPA: hypothetical protein VGC84_13520 [Ilumatobacteraceae bacterium]